MKIIKFGDRVHFPAYFDMSARFAPPGATWYGRQYRIGDRAGAHVWLADWRLRNPDRRLVVIEDSVMPGTEWSRYLPGTWLFGDVVDELQVVERVNEHVPRPVGEPLYHVSMWRIWHWLSQNKLYQPTIRPLPGAVLSAQAVLKELGVPERYVTIQPLFDAGYDRHRNGRVDWWQEAVNTLAARVPLVVLGDVGNAKKISIPSGAFAVWERKLNPMESLALISNAVVHVGGATGTTLWAPILGVPVVAVYRGWSGGFYETRPLSFGKPVVYSPLDGDLQSLVSTVARLWDGRPVESTPL